MMNPIEKLQRQAQRRAGQKASQATTGCLISGFAIVLAGCIVTGLAAYIGWQFFRTSSDPMAGGWGNAHGTAIWDGTGPLVCAGSQVLDVPPITAALASGAAIEASGNCRMTLHGVNVTAPIALRVSGNAEVIVDGGSLVGTEASIVAGANAHVVIQGATVSGAVQRTANARIDGM